MRTCSACPRVAARRTSIDPGSGSSRSRGWSTGRDKGLVWHTLRHEFCSRTAENTGDPVVVQELARHKDLRTTFLPPQRVDPKRIVRGERRPAFRRPFARWR